MAYLYRVRIFLYVILCNEELTFFENDHIRFTIGDYFQK